MILWHTVDGWIRPALKSGPGFDTLRVFGGTAAPMFVALAGASATMKACADHAKGLPAARTTRDQIARGLHVMVTGYALRVFMWLVDGAAIRHFRLAPAYVPIVLGIGFVLRGLELVPRSERRALPYVGLGAVSYAGGLVLLSGLDPGEVHRLLRVDVLTTIGASLAIVAGLDALVGLSRRPVLGLALGFVVALGTETMERTMPGALPIPVAALLSKWGTPLGQDISRFPLFPWLGYALVGSAVGGIWFRGAVAGRAMETMLAVLVVGGAVAALYNLHVTSSLVAKWSALQKPLFMLHKIGFGLVFTGLVSVVSELLDRHPFQELGKTSMLIYWVHLELAYGMSGKPFVRMLGYGGWAIGFVVLTLLMMWAAHLRTHPPAMLDGLGRRLMGEAPPRKSA